MEENEEEVVAMTIIGWSIGWARGGNDDDGEEDNSTMQDFHDDDDDVWLR